MRVCVFKCKTQPCFLFRTFGFIQVLGVPTVVPILGCNVLTRAGIS